MIELRGVRNSCATEEKKVALFFFSSRSIYLSRVISVQTAIKWRSAFIKDVLTERYVFKAFDLKIASLLLFDFSCLLVYSVRNSQSDYF